MQYYDECDVMTDGKQLQQNQGDKEKYLIDTINGLRLLYTLFKNNEEVIKSYNNRLRVKFINELLKARDYNNYCNYFIIRNEDDEMFIEGDKVYFTPLIYQDKYIKELPFESYVLLQIRIRIIDLIITFLHKNDNPNIIEKRNDLYNFFYYYQEIAIDDYYKGFINPHTITNIRNFIPDHTSSLHDILIKHHEIIFCQRGWFGITNTYFLYQQTLNKEKTEVLITPKFQMKTDIIELPKPFKIDIRQYDYYNTPQDYIDGVNKSIADGFKNSESAIKLCFEKSVDLFDKLIEKTEYFCIGKALSQIINK